VREHRGGTTLRRRCYNIRVGRLRYETRLHRDRSVPLPGRARLARRPGRRLEGWIRFRRQQPAGDDAFRHQDGVLTGSISGLPTDPANIKDGKFDGDTVTFWIDVDYQDTTYRLFFKGKVTGDEIHFQFGTQDGAWGAVLVVKRAS
jgi:hypothetical protein